MSATHPFKVRALLLLCLAAPVAAQAGDAPQGPAPAAAPRPPEVFAPLKYRAELQAAHDSGAADHVLVARKVVKADKDAKTGKVTVVDVAQTLDGRTGKLKDQARCTPCVVDAAAWPPRPVGVWFVEESWTTGDAAGRARALERLDHFGRYFQLAEPQEVEQQGITWQFRRFEGRRPVPLAADEAAAAPAAPSTAAAPEAPSAPAGGADGAAGPSKPTRVDIFHGRSRTEEVPTDPGSDTVALEAVAWAAREGAGLTRVEAFQPMWSSSCGTPSDPRARATRFTLEPGVRRCRVHLYEARTGLHDTVTVVRADTAPPVRVVLTFEGGQEADAVALTGNARSLEVAARAFDPAGRPLHPDFEWGVEGGRVRFLDDAHTRLRVHLDPDAEKAVIRVRDPASGAEDSLVVEVR